MTEIFLYNHGGSANHGCEALVKTICTSLKDKNNLSLLSELPQEDFHYNLQKIVRILPAKQRCSKFNVDFLKAYIHLKKTGDYFPMDVLPYLKSIRLIKKGDIGISIGGDVYCYEDYQKYILLHDLIYRRECKTVLIGCSLEANLFSKPEFITDMKKYVYISARESLTFQLLKNAGLTNISLRPDSAFTLKPEYIKVPVEFQENNTIGINVSPLVIRKEKKPGIVYANLSKVICWILENTDCSITLIPHVVWENNDDRVPLNKLLKKYETTRRVVMIEDSNCNKLKGYISRCRLFIGARTHATIAAYSTCVPTLVLGYSIKSKGIATDLFGTDEKYVIPVQSLEQEDDLTRSFIWLWENEGMIRKKLQLIMPGYIQKASMLDEDIREYLGEKE